MSENPPALPRRTPVTPAGLRADLWLAGALVLGAVLSSALGTVAGIYHQETPGPGWALLYSVAIALPLAVRRRFPGTVAIVVSVVFFVGMSSRIPEVYIGNITLFIAMYTVGAWVDDRRRATLVRVLVVVGMFVWLLATTFQAATAPTDPGFSRAGLFSPFAAYMLIQFLVNVAFFGGAWYMGNRAYTSALERAALEQRTAELERERELTAAQAVTLERVRIARELHDVVAHHVSAMGVQAGAARTVLGRDPERAERALVGVEESARHALEDLRNLLQTLRTNDSAQEDAVLPAVGLDALPELVAHATANGLPTTLHVIGDPAPCPDLLQLNLYRIAQEALTNARRHGGPEAQADVRLRFLPHGIELEIANSGRDPLVARPGLGLVGIRERALASGGTAEIGPRARGGFLVRVHVPLGPAATTPAIPGRRGGAA